MSQRVVPVNNIEDGPDRQNINVLHKRFMSINNDRLHRMRGALTERQRLFLDVLPLLFHTNHPMMPGYVSRKTPSKVVNYKPEKRDLANGKAVALSFTVNHAPKQADEIYGIYVMGSVGTIAQSEASDLDIWLCYQPGIEKSAIAELELKCERISEWAKQLRLEAHFFLMDSDAFRRGQMTALNEESSGNAQKLLLLDEFYRTAIYIAGQIPIWWFVPSRAELQYDDYTETLLHKRFVPKQHVIDFGCVATIPNDEFVGAGIWQLYKAIASPYKSVLKLLLLEAYVSEFPRIKPLSLTFKSQVYNGELDIDELDSYVMIYRRIEQYLTSKKEVKRLELARRCFYFKVRKPLTRPMKGRTKSWQRKLLEKLTSEWGWSYEQLALLDKRSKWKAPHVALERSLLVTELNHSYQFLLEFANTTGTTTRAISNDELTVLGRKLQAAFERRPGKIEWINPGISDDLSEKSISITESYDKSSQMRKWNAYSLSGTNAFIDTKMVIKSSPSLLELVLWCYFNGVFTLDTQFELLEAPCLSDFEFRKILSTLMQWLPLPLKPLPHRNFQHTSRPEQVLFLINAGKSPTPRLEQKGVQRLSSNVDALNYSGFEDNLVVSIDMLVRNNWNELNTRRFDGENALLDALQEYLQLCLPGTNQAPPNITIECAGSSHAGTITKRLEQLIKEIGECFYGGVKPPSTRYIYEMGGNYCSLQFKGMKPHLDVHQNEKSLLNYLGRDQAVVSPIVIDSKALTKHPLKVITRKNKEKTITVFYRRFDIGMEIYVIDEKGSMTHVVLRRQKNQGPLKPLHRFLRSVINRQVRMNENLLADFGIYPVEFYELTQDTQHRFSCAPRRVSTDITLVSMFEIKAIAHTDTNNALCFDFYCDDQEFSAHAFGDELYMVVAQFILSRRKSNESYPIYITDLDLSLCANVMTENGELQISHYLKIKNALEFKLNQAIGLLLKA